MMQPGGVIPPVIPPQDDGFIGGGGRFNEEYENRLSREKRLKVDNEALIIILSHWLTKKR